MHLRFFSIVHNGEVINCPLGLLLQNVKSRFNGFVFNNKKKGYNNQVIPLVTLVTIHTISQSFYEPKETVPPLLVSIVPTNSLTI